MAKKRTSSALSGELLEQHSRIGAGMSFAAAEAYKLLRTNILFSFPGAETCRIIGVTSASQGEGKSLTSINLARSLSQAGKRVLLIEGDMRLPTLSGRLSLKSSPGLSNLLVGLNNVSDTIYTYDVSTADGDSISTDVLVSGDIPPNPSELLGSERMQALLSRLRERYDYILLDLPPVTAVTDALVVSRFIDGMLVVVRNGRTERGILAETIRQLELVDAKLLGFVYNGAPQAGSTYYKARRPNRRRADLTT